MARKGKDTDVTVTVKTEEEWNKLIESEVATIFHLFSFIFFFPFLLLNKLIVTDIAHLTWHSTNK